MDDQLLSGRHVLVIEDEMLVLMVIEDMLSDLGCTSITVAGNIEKALELIASQSFDLATLDVNLNGRRSHPIAQALNEAGVPFAISTGYGEHGVGADYGDRPVLSKPYSPTQLVAVLTTLLPPVNPLALAA
ncbi:MAG: response regulator [Sphingomicrobium sp.]